MGDYGLGDSWRLKHPGKREYSPLRTTSAKRAFIPFSIALEQILVICGMYHLHFVALYSLMMEHFAVECLTLIVMSFFVVVVSQLP